MKASGCVIVVTGAMASGKSTVAEQLARRLPRSVHLRGDHFRTMIVNGRADMSEAVTPEALEQLRLRYRLSTAAAGTYAAAGFTVVLQDVVIGPELTAFVDLLPRGDRFLIVLAPDVETLRRREDGRSKTGYGGYDPAGLDRILREQTPRLGLWLDTSHQTAEETVDEIVRRLPEARI